MFIQAINEVDKTERDILSEYYHAVSEACNFNDFAYLKDFKEKYPKQYKFYVCVHNKRSKVSKCISAMRLTNRDVYFGTLTFNETKNKNKRSSKRKEAFVKLNSVFKYVLLVEELGEEKGRYHIHFVGVFRDGKEFNDFVKVWHSRQNIEKINNINKVSNYLVKYVMKELPRIRRNKALIGLEREYRKGLIGDRSFPNCGIGSKEKVSVFDLLETEEVI